MHFERHFAFQKCLKFNIILCILKGIFFWKKYNSMHFERVLFRLSKCMKFNIIYAFWKAFHLSKCIKLYFFQRTWNIFLGFTSKFRYGRVTLNTGIFYLALALLLTPISFLNYAATCDFQQCGILTSVDSEEPVQSHFKLRAAKRCSASSLTLIEYLSD